MSEKPTQQHRQHFNLSEEGKQKLEELTARRYPGKQRRQSQLVEDLITEAFAKERGMSTSSTGSQEPPDRLATATYEALNLAQRRASSMQAREVYPEHLLLALFEQGHSGTLKALNSLRMDDVPIIRNLVISTGAWHVAEELYKHGEMFKAKVTGYSEGGLIVDVSGIRGFVPISQLLNLKLEEVASGVDDQEIEAKLQDMVGRELQLKIIEMNRERKILILSERLAQQEWRQQRREELLAELKPGEVRRGVVSNIANFGAFVDLGGAEGLVHLSQIAWSGVNHPSEVLKVGQEVVVHVLSVDKDKKKIALSIKRGEVRLIDENGEMIGVMPTQRALDIARERNLDLVEVQPNAIPPVCKLMDYGRYKYEQAKKENEARKKSIKRAEVDPWTTVEQRYTPGQVVTGVITRIVLPFGAFARIEDAIEGIIRLSELPPGTDPMTSLHVGQHVQVRILRFDAERHCLELSLRQVDEPDPVVTIKDVPLEESSATIEEAASTKAGEPGGNITFSLELLECIHRAVAIAKRMRSELVQPEHLLLGVLQNERIQNSFAPWLPSLEVLSNPTIIVGFTEDEQTRLSACPFCGRSVQPHWKHCVYCGKSLARVCPKCGTPRAEAEGVRFCYECGSPFE